MATLEETLLTNEKTDKRFHATEQQTYLGTLLERIILKITFDEFNNQNKKELILKIFPKITQLPNTNPVYLKISHHVNIKDQIHLIKLSEKFGITSTVVSDTMTQSSYALIFHTDLATNLSTDCMSLDYFLKTYAIAEKPKIEHKKNFLQKLFNIK